MSNVKLHFYSERGIVNSIIFWMYNNKNEVIKLLNTIKDAKGNPIIDKREKLVNLDVYDEFSFGEFGSPDLILKIETNTKKYVFIVEAKVDTYSNSSVNIDDYKNVMYRGNASKLNIQLSLRKRFVDSYYSRTDNAEKIINNDIKNPKLDYIRKLEKKELIDWCNELFLDVKPNNIYYISLTDDNKNINPYKLENMKPTDFDDENNKYGYWLYKDIEDVIDSNEYKNAWKYTDESRNSKIEISHEIWDNKPALEFNSNKYETKNNKTAITIFHKNANAIFRIWKIKDDDINYAVEIIDSKAFEEEFMVEGIMKGNYYLINKPKDIKEK